MSVEHFSSELSGLEAALAFDPFADVHAVAREYEDLINSGALTEQDQHELFMMAQVELDTLWPYMGERVHISGQAHVLVDDMTEAEDGSLQPDSGVMSYKKIAVENVPGTSLGFAAMAEPIVVGGENVATKFRLAHYVKLDPTNVFEFASHLSVDRTLYLRMATDEGVITLDDENERPLNMASLEYLYSDVMSDFDSRVLNSSSVTECLAALHDVDLSGVPDIYGSGTDELLKYLEKIIELKRPLPYEIRGFGHFFVDQSLQGSENMKLVPTIEGTIVNGYAQGFKIIPRIHKNGNSFTRIKGDNQLAMIMDVPSGSGDMYTLLIPIQKDTRFAAIEGFITPK